MNGTKIYFPNGECKLVSGSYSLFSRPNIQKYQARFFDPLRTYLGQSIDKYMFTVISTHVYHGQYSTVCGLCAVNTKNPYNYSSIKGEQCHTNVEFCLVQQSFLRYCTGTVQYALYIVLTYKVTIDNNSCLRFFTTLYASLYMQ